jgi:transposase-like protein
MGLSRRKFTKEFEEAAVRRLELGASIAEVARTQTMEPSHTPWPNLWREIHAGQEVLEGRVEVEEPSGEAAEGESL